MRYPIILAIILCLVSSANAEKIHEKFPNGKTKLAYITDKDGKKHGPYAEYFENSKPKIRCNYRSGLLSGNYVSYFENGRPHKSITYKEGKKNGQYLIRDEKGKVVSDLFYAGDLLIYPKSKNLLKAQLKLINSRKGNKAETAYTSKPHTNAVNLLNSYRCIVGLDFDVKLKDSYCKTAQAGAELCAKIGKLSHTPKNPGLPEDVYKAGYQGTSKSNLSMGSAMQITPARYMDDSDKSNIDRVGHRRWCINPKMMYTGFGSKGKFSAMYAFDNSRSNVPDYDFTSFPAVGYHPAKYFSNHYAWSISLNPSKYSAPNKSSVKTNVYQLGRSDRLPLKTEGKKPLKLNYFNINNSGFGVKYCIIFRPEKIKVSSGAKYWVEITGLKDKSGKTIIISYLVEFANI
jgi:hypothetical protein